MDAYQFRADTKRNKIEKELRRYRDRLEIVGEGVMILGFWSVLKGYLFLALNIKEIYARIREETQGYGMNAVVIGFAIIFFMMLVVAGVPLLFRTYIGRNAIAEARGENKRNKILYIIFSVILVFDALFSLLGEVTSIISSEDKAMLLSGMVIEVTGMIAVIEMLHAIYKVRTLLADIKGIEAQNQLMDALQAG